METTEINDGPVANIRKARSSDFDMTIAFVGNPSVGKSAFFSRLTGVGVVVANYPGTTVELTHGSVNVGSKKLDVVDLPGIYSLGASTEDEKVAKRYFLREYPDVIINVVDATRLERNLFLTLQLLELNIPMVVALNQMDAAKEMGIEIDIEKLSETPLGCLWSLPSLPKVSGWKRLSLQPSMRIFPLRTDIGYITIIIFFVQLRSLMRIFRRSDMVSRSGHWKGMKSSSN